MSQSWKAKEENRRILGAMAEGGDDLEKPRRIDFFFAFPSKEKALSFQSKVESDSFELAIDKTDTVAGLPWDVTVSAFMIPSCDAITAVEVDLDKVALLKGGRNDGWGFFEVKK